MGKIAEIWPHLTAEEKATLRRISRDEQDALGVFLQACRFSAAVMVASPSGYDYQTTVYPHPALGEIESMRLVVESMANDIREDARAEAGLPPAIPPIDLDSRLSGSDVAVFLRKPH